MDEYDDEVEAVHQSVVKKRELGMIVSIALFSSTPHLEQVHARVPQEHVKNIVLLLFTRYLCSIRYVKKQFVYPLFNL